MRKQTTLASTCSVSGRGYWSGKANTLTFLPAEANCGVRFVRSDLPGSPSALAVAENCIGQPLRTRLQENAAQFDMIEHVMAALYGLQIDNVIVECTSAEIPGFDGSCHPIALPLANAGFVELAENRPTLLIDQVHEIGSHDQFIRLEPLALDQPQNIADVGYELDYGAGSVIGQATFSTRLTRETFLREIAAARTFISSSDAQKLQAQGLATHVTERDLLVFDDHGPVNNTLRFEDECARHKTLDLIGDLALAGCDLVGRIRARKTGHQTNGEMARKLRAILTGEQSTEDRTRHAA